MLLWMYSVYDKAVKAYDRPFCARQHGEAIRIFSDAVNDKDSPFFKHPNDFELYYICQFDTDAGDITDAKSVRLIAALEVIDKVV